MHLISVRHLILCQIC